MRGGKPCGMKPYDKPPRYAPNVVNKKRFAKAPWNGKIPACPVRKITPRKVSPLTSKSTSIRRSSPPARQMSSNNFDPKNFPFIVLEKGREIGRGKESVVYKYENKAVKIYDDNFDVRDVQNNIDFLTCNRKTGVVPLIYRSSAKYGWIEMELLPSSEYHTLKSTVKQASASYRESLLDALTKARAQLPANVEYKDMKNFNNIAVRHNKQGHVTDVKFFEGGVTARYNDKLRGRQYVADMAALLNMRRYCNKNQYCNIRT